MTQKTAISPTRQENYPEWYQQVIRAAELADNAPVRGCMVIRPWGYGVWEKVQRELDARIKETGHENAYFPLFIPLRFMEKEAQHVSGFAKECAVVTHHRLIEKDGKLVPDGELEEPLIVRPTSEAIIGECFRKWIESYRDLPLLINQWANVVRWELRPRLFLRTAEFLWQEGHTVHESEQEAREEVVRMLGVYQDLARNVLAFGTIVGEKTAGERFPGAVQTLTLEAMMQDRKALQAGTSHYLGQSFAEAAEIQFLSREGELQTPHTTSWGVSTRLIGALIMVHSDDDGLRLPPRVAPKHAVVLPVITGDDTRAAVLEYANKIKDRLRDVRFDQERVVIHLDDRDLRGGEKSWQWIKKGIPLRIEVGPRDIKEGKVVLYRRDQGAKEKEFLTLEELAQRMPVILEEIHQSYLSQSESFLAQHTHSNITNFEDLKSFFTPKNADQPEIHGGFVVGKWCNDPEEEKKLHEHKITIRCLPLEQSGSDGKCIVTGRATSIDAVFAKTY